MGRWALWGFGKILTKCISLCHLSQPPSSQAPWLHEDYKCFMLVCLKPTASIWLPLSPFIPESQWSTTGPPQARGPGVAPGTWRRRECCSWSVLQIAFLIQVDSTARWCVCFYECITEWETRSMAFVSSRYRVLVGAIGWLFHCGVNFTLGSVCEARHTRLLAWTHMCVVSSDQRVKLNERSWERAERVWSKTCSHACLMKSG